MVIASLLEVVGLPIGRLAAVVAVVGVVGAEGYMAGPVTSPPVPRFVF